MHPARWSFSHRKYKKTNYELEKEALAAGNSRMPDIGYNVGIYNFSPAWKEIYPVQKFDAAKISEAMKQLPAKAVREDAAGGRPRKAGRRAERPFGEDLCLHLQRRRLRSKRPAKDPGDKTAELARKYNVCFIVISYAADPDGVKRVKDMGKANACSRVIPFDSYITNPYYALGPLVLHERP